MLSDLLDTHELSEDENNYRSFERRAVAKLSSNIFDRDFMTFIPGMLIERAGRYLWDVKSLRRRGKTIVSLDALTVLRNARHALFMTETQYNNLEPFKRAHIEAVVAEMLNDVGQYTSMHDFTTNPSCLVVGYKAESPDGEGRWFDNKREVLAFVEKNAEKYLETWGVGTVFADGYVNYDELPKSSGFSTEDLAAVATANETSKLTQQWDFDCELAFPEPNSGKDFKLH